VNPLIYFAMFESLSSYIFCEVSQSLQLTLYTAVYGELVDTRRDAFIC